MINIAEILKDYPKGTKLYSPIFGEVYLDKIRPYLAIVVTTDKEQGNFKEEFLYDGKYGMNGECMLFPSKDQRDWNKFQRPFKDGDVVYIKTKGHNHNEFIIIFKEIKNDHIHKYVCFAYQVLSTCKSAVCHLVDVEFMRLATEEEKEILFDAIKSNGYKWNAETKTLEKIIVPKFKVGDKIVEKDNPFKYWYVQGIDTYCNSDFYYIVTKGQVSNLHFKDQDNWELVPNKFDISTLTPFESKVLVRDSINSIREYDEEQTDVWRPAIWGVYVKDNLYPFGVQGGCYFNYCIPYEGNEHLLGTTDDCDEFYKNW